MTEMTPVDATTIGPVRARIDVAVSQRRAFEFFTAQMMAWWLPEHHIGEDPMVDLVVEPRVGGRWFERDAAGHECQWGRVLAWQPDERVVLAWQLDNDFEFDAELLTELEVRFVAVGESTTRVELEHRGLEAYGTLAERRRTQFDGEGGWQTLLDRFAVTV